MTSLLQRLVITMCVVSLICYLAFSQYLRHLIADWKYYIELFKMAFPKGFSEGIIKHIPTFTYFTNLHDFLLFIGFFSTCMLSAWLIHSILRGKRSELGPHLLLFSLAVAIVPSLFFAMIYWPDGRGVLTLELSFYSSSFIAIVLAVLKLRVFPKNVSSKRESQNRNRKKLGWAWAFILPVLLLFILVYLIGFISIIGYDAMAYHLPLAASWYHNGSIIRGANIQFYYPGNPELILRWGFIGSSEQLVLLVPFFSAIFCIYMVYKLGCVIGQEKQTALIAACCAATVPTIPFLATTAYTDTIGVLFLLISVFFLIRWLQTEFLTSSHLFCAGLATGLAAGSKLSMLTSAFAIFLVMILIILRSRNIWRISGSQPENVGLNWPWLLSRTGCFFSAAFVGGGYWYLRNLIEQGNPFYPVTMFGLPGFELKTILPMQSEFVANPWKWFLSPWTELAYTSPYDDGIGAVTTAIVLPSLFMWPFIHKWPKGMKRIGPGVIYCIAWVSLLLFAYSDNMTSRYGLFLILICFILLGELWMAMSSLWFRAITFVSFLIMSLVIMQSLAGGYLYTYLRHNESRNEKLNVPEVVDLIPSALIFNAAGAEHTYGLMGSDYRHEVITLYRGAGPEDVLTYKPTYILLRKAQIEIFQTILILEPVGTETSGANPVSLWKIIYTKQGIP